MGKHKVTTLFSWWDFYGDIVLDVLSRGAKTAVQTATAAGLLGYTLGGDYAGAKTAALAGLAAGISVVWNAVVAWANR